MKVGGQALRQCAWRRDQVAYACAGRYTGTTSMEVGIKVITKNIQTQTVRHANSCFFTMVAVNEERKATAVQPDEERRFVAAQARKELRRQ